MRLLMTQLIVLPGIFLFSTLTLWLLLWYAPPLSQDEYFSWTFASKFDNFTDVVDQLKQYKDEHFEYISTVFVAAYIYKQSFAIPGSFFLNLLAGTVFGLWAGFLLVCILTTIGSTFCYLFAEFFGREYVLYYFGQQLHYLQHKLDDNASRLLPFLLFVRIFPISPSWLLNIVAPFLNIPISIFAFSALIAGYILSDLHSWNDVFDSWTLVKLCSIALIPLTYAMFVRPRANESNFEISKKSEVV